MIKTAGIFLLMTICTQMLNAQDRDISYLSSGGRLKPLQAIMDIRHYTIALDVDITKQTINGSTDIDIILSQNTDTLLFDLVHLLTVSKVKVNNKDVKFEQKNDLIYITSTKPFLSGKQTIKISYGGAPPVAVRPPWLGGFTWTKDRSGNPWVAINCQKEGGRIYFPCKDHPGDEPNEGVDMLITVPKGLVVAGPGLLQKVTNKKDKQTYHWKTNYTISNYCVIFNIGKYKVASQDYTTINNHVVPIQFYVLEEDFDQAKKVLELRARDTRIMEKYFGEYPWYKEKIGIGAVPNSGMEHQTMITFQNKFVYTKLGEHDYSENLLHEFAHEWWANKVTNKTWSHIWIQEGIGTYAEALANLELGGEAAYDAFMSKKRRAIRYKKPMVIGDDLSEDEIYSGGDIYTKGAFFMHTLRYVMGDDIFFPTLKKLATDPQYTYDNFVNTDDVEKLFSRESKQNLKPLFDLYTRTTDQIDITVKEIDFQKYSIKVNNYFMDLPFDISSSEGTKRMMIGKDGITVTSTVPPIVDGKGYYLKKVSIQ